MDEKEEMLKQVLENAGYGYEPKPKKDGDEIWTPSWPEMFQRNQSQYQKKLKISF